MAFTEFLFRLIAVGVFFAFDVEQVAGGEWNYDDVRNWGSVNENCNGKAQSPIGLNRGDSKTTHDIDIQFSKHYRTLTTGYLSNNGHSVSLKFEYPDSRSNPYLTYSSSATGDVKYYLRSLHYHWGSRDRFGSEHTINGKRYPLEMHIIHERTVDDEDSRRLLVLGFMFEICNMMNWGMQEVSKYLSSEYIAKYKNEEVKIEIKPSEIMDRNQFHSCNAFIYNGSLTTPPCTEEVQWVVYNQPLCVSEQMLDEFRDVEDGEGYPLVNNYRPVQDLNDRNVYFKPAGNC